MSAAPIPPAAIAGAVTAARDFLRSPGDDEPGVMAQFAASALLIGEAFTGTLLIARAVEEAIPAATAWRLLAEAPVRAIDAVGDLPPADYAIDIDGDARGWVRFARARVGRVTVRYTAGLAADWAGLRAPLAQGVVALIAHLYEDRGRATQPPAAVTALWRPYRRMRLATERRS